MRKLYVSGGGGDYGEGRIGCKRKEGSSGGGGKRRNRIREILFYRNIKLAVS